MNPTRRPSTNVWLAVLTLVIVLSALLFVATRTDTAALRANLKRQHNRGNLAATEQLCLQLLAAEPDADDIRLIAAECAVKRDRPEEALNWLRQIKTSDEDIQLPAVLMTAELLHYSLYRLSDAETAYRTALRLSPNNTDALIGMAQLLAACGRRREALPCVFELVRQGEVSDLLIFAARSSGAINDPDLLQWAISAVPNDGCALLGLALHANEAGQTELAIQHCRDAIKACPKLNAAQVALGQYLLQARRFDELVVWNAELTDDARSFPETWQVIGQLYEYRNDPMLAIEAFQTAVRLGPDLKTALYRLSILCRQGGDDLSANYFADRLSQLRELEVLQDRMFEAGPKDPSKMLQAIKGFQECGRIWEALGWTLMAIDQHGPHPDLQRSYEELRQKAIDLPLTLYTTDAIPVRTVNILANSQRLPPDEPPLMHNSGSATTPNISFRNDAASSGLKFRFRNGVVGPTTHRMFEFTGGGIGVIDIDVDDYPDVFFTQGGLWQTEESVSNAGDSVFRNHLGRKFSDVTDEAGIADVRFGQGVAAGDINNDGFPDVLVANIGTNRLWVNCGDGTFTGYDLDDARYSTQSGGDSSHLLKWSTSAAIADLNLDGAADAYVVNYLAGHDVFTRVCSSETGDVRACVPTHFEAAPDDIYLNQDGHFSNASHTLKHIPPGKGLGVLVLSPLNNGRPSIYVANDTTPNMLLTLDRFSDGHVDDVGMEKGVALNAAGKSEGSMGIAAADLNADGLMELFVTNFYNESNTLYLQAAGEFFDDRTAEWNLRDLSLPLLGFGAQFLDANSDTFPELFVANGHVDDLRQYGKPYHMRAQMLALQEGQFKELPAAVTGQYFLDKHLGRAVAVLDWNRDQQPDLLVGHLDEEYALLTNTSTAAADCVSVQLIGVTSSRDAVPATASFHAANRRLVHQLQAGDGYFCSNEKTLLLAGIPAGTLSEVTIRWPSEARQTFADLKRGRRYAAVEHRPSLYSLPD